MDNAARMFASPTEITLGGKKFKASARFAQFHAEAEQWLLKQQPDPIALAKRAVEEFADNPIVLNAMLDKLTDRALQARFVSRETLGQWFDTVEGTAFITWTQIREHHPEMTDRAPDGSLSERPFAKVEELLRQDIEQQILNFVRLNMEREVAEQEAMEKIIGDLHRDLTATSGEDPLGNSTGSAATAKQVETTKAANTSPSPGVESAEA